MTNSLAIIIGCLIVGLIAVDIVFFDTVYLLFLARKLLELMTWLAFWR